MRANLAKCLEYVFADEGGFVIRDSEPGGAGNLGVSFQTFEEWRDEDVTYDDLKALDKKEAGRIYEALYWNKIDGDNLPGGVDYCVFDSAINDGVGGSKRLLEEALNNDGWEALKSDPALYINKLCDLCLERKKGKVGWKHYGRGWTKRINRRRERALAMAEKANG